MLKELLLQPLPYWEYEGKHMVQERCWEKAKA